MPISDQRTWGISVGPRRSLINMRQRHDDTDVVLGGVKSCYRSRGDLL
jgi:hypothetical protein